MTDKVIHICPVKALYLKIREGEAKNACAVVSSSGQIDAAYMAQIPHVFRQYHDVDMEIPGHSFSPDDANAFAAFIKRIDSPVIYCCCDAGESRSPAVAAAVCRWFGLPDAHIWSNPHFHPNMLVFDMLTNALGIPVSDEEKDRLLYENRTAFRKAIRGS